MTTQEVREKLGGIMESITTFQFSEKYRMIRSQLIPEFVSSTISTHSDAADAYISLASKHVSDEVMLNNLSLCANPLVVFVVYFRYHRLTQVFMNSDPKKVWNFSDESGVFLTNVLIDEWRTLNAK